MPWVEPKTDWGRENYYNFGDLNRVESNTEFIASIISVYFKDTIVVVNKNRNMKSIEFNTGLNLIENNINLIKDNFCTPVLWTRSKTDWRSGDVFNYKDANRLENNLLHLFNFVQDTVDNFKYCGTLSCGEEII